MCDQPQPTEGVESVVPAPRVLRALQMSSLSSGSQRCKRSPWRGPGAGGGALCLTRHWETRDLEMFYRWGSRLRNVVRLASGQKWGRAGGPLSSVATGPKSPGARFCSGAPISPGSMVCCALGT